MSPTLSSNTATLFLPTPLINCKVNELSMHPEILTPLIEDHLRLCTKYHILISTLRQLDDTAPPSDALITLVTHTRELALVLGYLFENYLSVPREALRLQNHADLLRDWIIQHTPPPTTPLQKLSTQFQKPDTLSRQIHTLYIDYNQPRLILTRTKRLLSALKPFLDGIYPRIISPVEKIANPTLNYISWIFFFPRFVSNSTLLLKHLIPGSWMSASEQSLPASFRLKTAFKRHWAELCNDSVWCANGLLGCFLLLGAAAPIASYVTGILYGYDILISSINAAVELSRLEKLRQHFAENHYPREVQQQLAKQIAYEKRRFALSITTNILLTAAIILTLPFIISNPIFPLIGACLLLSFTIASYALGLTNKKTNPDTYSSHLANHGIFHKKPTQSTDETSLTPPLTNF